MRKQSAELREIQKSALSVRRIHQALYKRMKATVVDPGPVAQLVRAHA